MPLSKIFLLTAAVFMAVSVPSLAHAKSFWDSFFGRINTEEGPQPEETLQAPFVKKTAKPPATGKLAGTYLETKDTKDYENVNRLENPNRTSEQIVDWGIDVATLALTIDPTKQDDMQKKMSQHFIPYALEEYKTYLASTGILDTLTKNNMMMKAISSEGGLLTRQGAIGGTYHWLVKIPVMVSFFPRDLKTLDKKTKIQSQQMIVEIQIGRIAKETPQTDGLAIERWRVTSTVSE